MTEEQHIVLTCDMNNAAVDCLANGLFDAAQVLLVEAVRTVKALIEKRNDRNDESCVRENELVFSTESLLETRAIDFHRDGENNYALHGDESFVNLGNATIISPSAENRGFVYQRAFKLRLNHDVPAIEAVCAAILYNMGFGFHLNETVASCTRQGLQQAAVYYGLALSMCTHGTVNANTNGVYGVLHLAILNNLGEAYFRLCQYDDMVMVYDHMQSALYNVNVVALVKLSFLNGVEVCGLLWNMMFLKQPGVAAAA